MADEPRQSQREQSQGGEQDGKKESTGHKIQLVTVKKGLEPSHEETRGNSPTESGTTS